MNQTSPQTDENLAVPAHRSPHTFEVVQPETEPKLSVRGEINQRMRSHPIVEAYHNSPDCLFNDTEPSLYRIHEQPEHRIMVFLKARGISNKEIAERTNYTTVAVGDILRQPWARLMLVNEIKEAGRDAIQDLIKGAATDSVFKLIELRDNNKAPFAVQKAAADSLLDRFLGKAVQKVETKDVSLPSTPEIRKVEEEIASIDKQLQTPTQSNPNADAVAEPQTPNEKPQT